MAVFPSGVLGLEACITRPGLCCGEGIKPRPSSMLSKHSRKWSTSQPQWLGHQQLSGVAQHPDEASLGIFIRNGNGSFISPSNTEAKQTGECLPWKSLAQWVAVHTQNLTEIMTPKAFGTVTWGKFLTFVILSLFVYKMGTMVVIFHRIVDWFN